MKTISKHSLVIDYNNHKELVIIDKCLKTIKPVNHSIATKIVHEMCLFFVVPTWKTTSTLQIPSKSNESQKRDKIWIRVNPVSFVPWTSHLISPFHRPLQQPLLSLNLEVFMFPRFLVSFTQLCVSANFMGIICK